MGSYEDAVRTLEVELGLVEQAFRDLTDEQWRLPTKLRPMDETLPHWTVFELAGHFDISIGLTRTLVAEQQPGGQPGRDTIATPAGIAMTAAILDELLARRTVAGRPADLADDLVWVRAASGRAEHPDPRLPLIG